MTDRELMQMALEEDVCETPLVELLESVPKNARMIYAHSEFDSENIPVGDLCHKAAKALRDRLAQPDPDDLTAAYMSGLYDGKKKREWVGLTDEEIIEARNESIKHYGDKALLFAKYIEAKLKEKNT